MKAAALIVCVAVLTGCGGVANGGSNGGTRSSTGSGGTGGSGSTGGSGGTGTTTQSCSALTTGVGASLNGFVPFTSNNAWNQDISTAPVDANSAAIIATVGGAAVHADFGAGLYNGGKIGIPYVVVDGSQPQTDVTFTAYGDESDPGPMPIPATGPIEGDPNPGTGDRHVLVLDKGNCFLYELGSAYPGTGGTWSANVAVLWDMTGNPLRPYTWTSADAAGLPIFPGLVRYDEVAAGKIQHALRFTLQQSQKAFVAPASHWASSNTSTAVAPMGARFRLKSNVDISSYSAANQVILKALKQYGMIMADNGSSMYISGAPDDRWDNNDLHLLGNLHASDFEVVQMGTVTTPANVPQGAAPGIASFTASPSTTNATGTVTLNWSVSNANYVIISPQVGPVRGNSVDVKPGTSTTYTLSATNQYGRTTATVSVSVQ